MSLPPHWRHCGHWRSAGRLLALHVDPLLSGSGYKYDEVQEAESVHLHRVLFTYTSQSILKRSLAHNDRSST